MGTVLRDRDRDETAVEASVENPARRASGSGLTVGAPVWDNDLALGFLHREPDDEANAAEFTDYFAPSTVDVQRPLARRPGDRRSDTTSSCGVGGSRALEGASPTPIARAVRHPMVARAGGSDATGPLSTGGESSVIARTSAAETRWTR